MFDYTGHSSPCCLDSVEVTMLMMIQCDDGEEENKGDDDGDSG